jgi:lipopolysaccharide export system protein LptA
METFADSSDCLLTEDGKCQFKGNVVITQGTLKIQAATADVIRKGGEIAQVVLTGKPVRMNQLMDDGSPMEAVADRMEYDVPNEIITLIGNYTVTSPRGSNSGQRMVYNTRTGQMQGGGDGTRVHTILQPKTAAPAAAKPAAPAKKGGN